MQEVFDDVGVLSSQVYFEIVDEVVMFFLDFFFDEIFDVRDQDIFVMGVIKYIKYFGFWQSFFDVLKEVMFEFFLCWGFEVVMVDVLWVDYCDNMLYYFVFVGSVQFL